MSRPPVVLYCASHPDIAGSAEDCACAGYPGEAVPEEGDRGRGETLLVQVEELVRIAIENEYEAVFVPERGGGPVVLNDTSRKILDFFPLSAR